MTPEEQRVAIAEACGEDSDSIVRKLIPNYLNDLNAMHDAEKVLFDRNDWSACIYDKHLHEATSAWKWNATASQRAEAFLRTIGKWNERK